MEQIETNNITALDISLYVIDKLSQNKISITNIELQLILYCIFKEFLKHNIIVFNDKFEATIYGPKIESVYDKFHYFGGVPLNIVTKPKDILSPNDKAIIDKFLNEERNLDIYQLIKEAKDDAYRIIFNSSNNSKIIPLELIRASITQEDNLKNISKSIFQLANNIIIYLKNNKNNELYSQTNIIIENCLNMLYVLMLNKDTSIKNAAISKEKEISSLLNQYNISKEYARVKKIN